MANENETLEIKKKPQELTDKDLEKVSGGSAKCEDFCFCGHGF